MFRVSDLPFPNCLEGVDSGAGLPRLVSWLRLMVVVCFSALLSLFVNWC